MNKDLEFIIDVVKQASLLINDDFTIYAKDELGDVVTDCDYEVEKYIINRIKEDYPSFDIISEEYNNNNELTENCFTIDPIDGTRNFSNGIPLWAIQVACIKNRKTCAAVIYIPKLNELYYADENGAFLNGKAIKVNTRDIDKGLYCVEGADRFKVQAQIREVNQNMRDYYSSAVSLAWVASGRLSGMVLLNNSFWDYVPGQFIVEQAGGMIYNSDKRHIAANNIDFLEVLKK